MPRVLLATDADWIHEEIDAALGGNGTSVRRVRRGKEVLPAIEAALVIAVVAFPLILTTVPLRPTAQASVALRDQID